MISMSASVWKFLCYSSTEVHPKLSQAGNQNVNPSFGFFFSFSFRTSLFINQPTCFWAPQKLNISLKVLCTVKGETTGPPDRQATVARKNSAAGRNPEQIHTPGGRHSSSEQLEEIRKYKSVEIKKKLETSEQQKPSEHTSLMLMLLLQQVILPLCLPKSNKLKHACLFSEWFICLTSAGRRFNLSLTVTVWRRREKKCLFFPGIESQRDGLCFYVISANVFPTEAGTVRSISDDESSTLSAPLQHIPDPHCWLWFNLSQTEVGCRLQPVSLLRFGGSQKLAALVNPKLCCYIKMLF